MMCLPGIPKYHRRLANILEYEVASIQLLRHSMCDFDRYRCMRNVVAYQGHANFLRMDCRASRPLKLESISRNCQAGEVRTEIIP